MLVLVVILSFIVQFAFNITYLSKVVCIYIIVMEVVSIIENLKKAGVDMGKLTDLINLKKEEWKMKDKIIELKIIQEENGDLESNCNINMK